MHDKCLLELQQRLDENVESNSKDGSYEVSYLLYIYYIFTLTKANMSYTSVLNSKSLGSDWQPGVDASECCCHGSGGG